MPRPLASSSSARGTALVAALARGLNAERPSWISAATWQRLLLALASLRTDLRALGSQSDAARALGVDRATVSRLLREPPPDVVRWRALGTELAAEGLALDSVAAELEALYVSDGQRAAAVAAVREGYGRR